MAISQKDFELSEQELVKIQSAISASKEALEEQGEDMIGFEVRFLFTSVGRQIFVSANDDFHKTEVV